MSAHGGFDPTASMLPDPTGGSVPITVMRGGGRGGASTEIDDGILNPENQRILETYQLGPGGSLNDAFSDDVKQLFVEQIKSGLCTAGTGSAVITHKDCSAVVQVLRELYKSKIQSTNRKNIPNDTIETNMPNGTINISNYSIFIDDYSNFLEDLKIGIHSIDTINEKVSFITSRIESLKEQTTPRSREQRRKLETILAEINTIKRQRMKQLQSKNLSNENVRALENVSLSPTPAVNGVVTNDIPDEATGDIPDEATGDIPDEATGDIPDAATGDARISDGEGVTSTILPPIPPLNYGSITENSYLENPKNFQEGHMRINFNTSEENKRVYANASIGRQRTRVYGRNAANLKRKYNSRKRRLELESVEATNALTKKQASLEKERKEKEEATAKRKSELEATMQTAAKEAAIAADEAKRKANIAKAATNATKRAEKLAKEQEKRNATLRLTLEKNAVEKARLARIAAGQEKPGFSNRFKGVFKRGGGNKTRRKGRHSTTSRRRY